MALRSQRRTGGGELRARERRGEGLGDLSAPIYVQGRHWGGLRIGYHL